MILECSDDVRFGMIRLSSSRLAGRDSPERGLEVNEGAIMTVLPGCDENGGAIGYLGYHCLRIAQLS